MSYKPRDFAHQKLRRFDSAACRDGLQRRFVQSAANAMRVLGRDRSCATALNIGASVAIARARRRSTSAPRRGAARRKEKTCRWSIFVDKVFALSRFVSAGALRTSRLRRTADALGACAVENEF
jgi:hypothetical protein